MPLDDDGCCDDIWGNDARQSLVVFLPGSNEDADEFFWMSAVPVKRTLPENDEDVDNFFSEKAQSDNVIVKKKVRCRQASKFPKKKRSSADDSCSREGVANKLQNLVPLNYMPLFTAQIPPYLNGTLQDDFMEIFSPPRIGEQCRRKGLRFQVAADLVTGWNLLHLDDQIRLVQEVKARQPKVLGMSCPCTWFSQLMSINWWKIAEPRRTAMMKQAVTMLEFSMFLANLQMQSARGFYHEHPDGAMSWKNMNVHTIMSTEGCMVSRFDMCVFGLRSKMDRLPMRKRTRLLSNIPGLHAVLNKRFCTKDHDHVAIQGQEGGEKRSAYAQRYCGQFAEVVMNAVVDYCGM